MPSLPKIPLVLPFIFGTRCFFGSNLHAFFAHDRFRNNHITAQFFAIGKQFLVLLNEFLRHFHTAVFSQDPMRDLPLVLKTHCVLGSNLRAFFAHDRFRKNFQVANDYGNECAGPEAVNCFFLPAFSKDSVRP